MVLDQTFLDPLIDARALHFATTILATGALFFRLFVAEPAFRATGDNPPPEVQVLRRRWFWLVLGSLLGAVLSVLAWLVLLAANVYGKPVVDVCLDGSIWTVLSSTRFGQVSIVRLALAILLALAAGRPATAAAPMRRPVVSAVLAIALLTSLAWLGHAGAAPGVVGQFHLAADALHLVAASVWVGGLPPLATLLACARRSKAPNWPATAITAVRRFSLLGIASVGTLLATGTINAVNLVGSVGALFHSDYGQLLLMKLGLFVVMVGIAAINRLRLTPQLAAPAAIGRLRRNSMAETVLGLAVLLVVGALGTMPPASHSQNSGSYTASVIPPGAAFVHIHSEKGMAEVTIMPGHPGTSNASIRLLAEDLGPLAADAVTMTLTAPAAGSKPTTRIASIGADGNWKIKNVKLSRPGIWTVTVNMTLSTTHRLVITGPIVITPRSKDSRN
jgi:putative copper resistance protein D